MGTTMEMLAPFLQGWRGYFGAKRPGCSCLIRWVRLSLRTAQRFIRETFACNSDVYRI